jgi:hypothetical protein
LRKNLRQVHGAQAETGQTKANQGEGTIGRIGTPASRTNGMKAKGDFPIDRNEAAEWEILRAATTAT